MEVVIYKWCSGDSGRDGVLPVTFVVVLQVITAYVCARSISESLCLTEADKYDDD